MADQFTEDQIAEKREVKGIAMRLTATKVQMLGTKEDILATATVSKQMKAMIRAA